MVMPDFLNIVHCLGLKDQQHFKEWMSPSSRGEGVPDLDDPLERAGFCH